MIGHSPRLDGCEMRDSDVAYYGRLFNQWCHGTGMPTIDHPADEYFVQVARFDPSKGTIDVLDSYPMFPRQKTPKRVICRHGSDDDPDASEMPDMAVDLIHEVMSHLADKKALKSKVSGALRKAKPVIVTDVGGLLYRADLYRRMQGKAPGLVSDNVTTVGVVNSWLYTIRKLLEDLYGNLKIDY
ncbi:glycosyl transferase [Aspergillus fumigatus]